MQYLPSKAPSRARSGSHDWPDAHPCRCICCCLNLQIRHTPTFNAPGRCRIPNLFHSYAHTTPVTVATAGIFLRVHATISTILFDRYSPCSCGVVILLTTLPFDRIRSSILDHIAPAPIFRPWFLRPKEAFSTLVTLPCHSLTTPSKGRDLAVDRLLFLGALPLHHTLLTTSRAASNLATPDAAWVRHPPPISSIELTCVPGWLGRPSPATTHFQDPLNTNRLAPSPCVQSFAPFPSPSQTPHDGHVHPLDLHVTQVFPSLPCLLTTSLPLSTSIQDNDNDKVSREAL